VFGPGLPDRLRRLTPSGRRQMRAALSVHLDELRRSGAPPHIVAAVEGELAKYGGPQSTSGRP
jgi:hypothetical protein